MKTVSFEISDEDYEVLNEIARYFYSGCFYGDRPQDIRELAKHALLERRRSMQWALTKARAGQLPAAGELPGNVKVGPWKGRKAEV